MTITATIESTLVSQWLPFGAPANGVRLFCLPHAGGSASAYWPWSGRIDGVTVCPVQPPGREARLRHQPYEAMEPLASAVTDVLLDGDPVPYALFGHSLGALVGFEVLREIRRRGGPEPIHFFASGCPAPDFEEDNLGPKVARMNDAQVVGLLRALGGTPDWMLADETVLAMILPAFRADFAVKENYVYQPEAPLSTPITVIAATGDHRAGLATMGGWRNQTSAAYRTRTVTGGHFAVLEKPRETHQFILDALIESSGGIG